MKEKREGERRGVEESERDREGQRECVKEKRGREKGGRGERE